MTVTPRRHGERDQHRVVHGRHVHTVALEHGHVVFEVLPDFQNLRVFQHGFQDRHRLIQRYLIWRIACQQIAGPMTQRDIAGLVGVDRKRYANQPSGHAI